MVDKNPVVMRKFVEQAMKQKFLKDPKHREVPVSNIKGVFSLRPPYEQWDAGPNGGRVYI